MPNSTVYRKKRIVRRYSYFSELQQPEKAILDLLSSELREFRMLDIGVGGGRTTIHFAKVVGAYFGIDASEEMIEVCRERFKGYPDHVSFKKMDARDLSAIEDNSFDLVMFSFNGIDYISHEERLKAFTAIRRVLKDNGYFCFSSHNIQSIHKLFRLKHHLSFSIDLPKKVARWFLIRHVFNRNRDIKNLGDPKWTVINDGAERFGLQTYYVKPAEQIRQLEPFFETIRIFRLEDGDEIDSSATIEKIEDDWLYFLCS